MGRYNRLAPGTQPRDPVAIRSCIYLPRVTEESDFGEQIVEVSIEENGAAT
jgi:hypothetical protein